jgi:hypothetical protein
MHFEHLYTEVMLLDYLLTVQNCFVIIQLLLNLESNFPKNINLYVLLT